MMDIVHWIINMVIIFALAVVVHELGHLAAAKLVGMRVLEFGIGFPPRLWRFAQRNGTDYTINAIPIGGLCKIAGMDPEEADVEGGYYSKPYWARAIVLVAGSFMNVVLGIAVFVMMGPTLGIPTEQGAILGKVDKGSEAERMGLRADDLIVGINGKPVKYMEMIEYVNSHVNKPITLDVVRGSEKLALTGTPQPVKEDGKIIGRLGMYPVTNVVIEKFSVTQAPAEGLSRSWEMLREMTQALVRGTIVKDAGGPVAIGRVALDATRQGTAYVVCLLAMLSINLGFVNLLPIPILDGGHLALIPVDALHRAIRKRGLSPEAILRIQLTGFVLIVMAVVALTFRDIQSIMGG